MPRSGPDPPPGPDPAPAAFGHAGLGGSGSGGYLEAGLRAVRAVAAAPGPAEAYKSLLPALSFDLDAAVARLWLRDAGGEQMVCVDWWWAAPEHQKAAEPPFGVTCAPGVGLAGACWQARELLVVSLSDRPELFPNQDLLSHSGIATTVAVPLQGSRDVVGVLALYFAEAGGSSPAGLEELRQLGSALGAVIEAKQQDAAAREQLRRDQLLLDAASATAAAGGYHETLRMLAASSVPDLGDLCLIDLVTADEGLERVVAVHADPRQAALVDELKRYYAPQVGSPHPAGEVTATGRSVWSPSMSDAFLLETTRDARHYEIVKALGFTSYLSVPLRAGDEVLGAITLISAGSGRVFTEDDVATGERLAAQVAGTVARARELEHEQQRSAEAQTRSDALLELGRELAGAQGVEDVLRALMDSPVCSLGAGAARIGLLDQTRGMLQLTFAGRLEAELVSRYHLISMNSPVPIVDVVRRGRSMLVGDVAHLGRRYRGVVADTSSAVRAIALEPLRAEDGSQLGAFGLSWTDPRRFTPDETELLNAVAGVLSRAIARILVARREHEVAASLQERLLALDAGSPAAVVSAVYRPSGGEMRVGGDWYTARALGEGQQVGVSVGDVVGHGLDAVTTMTQLRSALDVAALGDTDPARVLSLLDRYAQGVPGASCATAVFARFDSTDASVSYACAGHPYPIVVLPTGEVQLLGEGRGAPLGIQPAGSPDSSGRADLPPGSLLVLYSDGLIERHGESLQAGLDRLAEVTADCRQLPAQAVCDELLARLAPQTGFSDDVVVVALRPVGTAGDCHVDCLPASFSEISYARHRLRAWLNDLEVDQPLSYDVLLAVGEAVNNAIEHASLQDPRRFVGIEAFADAERIAVSVTDSGRWIKDSASSRRNETRGRGLTLIHGLSDDVQTLRGPLGTRVTMTFDRQRHVDLGAQASGVWSS